MKSDMKMETTLFVGNLAAKTTEGEVRNLFAQIGLVNEVTIIIDRDTGTSKGFAFVTMNSQEDANSAIKQFNEHNMSNHVLIVNLARSRDQHSWSRYDSNQRNGYQSNIQNRANSKRYLKP